MKGWTKTDNKRVAKFAGQFYPKNEVTLTNQLVEFFEQAKIVSDADINPGFGTLTVTYVCFE